MEGLEQTAIELPCGRFELLRARGGRQLLLVLHGFPDHPPHFDDLLRRLAAAGYDVVAPWLRGYAPSTLEGPYHPARIAADALELASALGYRRFGMVGHDWGAIATYAACAQAPERVVAAVALSIPHPRSFARAPQLLRSSYMAALAGPYGAELAQADDFRFVDLLWSLWSPGFQLDSARRAALHACLRESWPAPARYYRALFGAHSLESLRARLRVPLLHLHGADDGCVSARTGRGQARFFAGPFASRLHAGVGHFLPLEAPEWVARETLRWLSLHGVGMSLLPAGHAR
ncbi:MAG TPA: alpha/beta hydrolase [Polyangiales bacterium]